LSEAGVAPGQEFVQPGRRVIGDAASTSASQARGSTSLSLAVAISEYMAAARSPLRSGITATALRTSAIFMAA
jgi:hypothetical protein